MDVFRWLRNQWDRAAALGALVVGLISLLLGWLGVSGSGLPAAQIPYLASGGLLGVFALGVAATLWLSADLRDEWRQLDSIRRSLDGIREAQLATKDLELTAESSNGRESTAAHQANRPQRVARPPRQSPNATK